MASPTPEKGLLDMKRMKIGVIGAGARGETFARQLYAGTFDAELYGVCDLDQDRLTKFCDYCELKNAYTSTNVEAFVNEPGLDAVIITVPEFAHKEVAIAAMKAGKPVYLEKPVAHNLEDGLEILEVSRSTGVLAYVGFNLRASPTYEKMKEIVASGVLGTLVHFSGLEGLSAIHGASFMRRFHRHSKYSGGLLNHKACHDIDIMMWVLGQPRISRISSFGGTRIFTPDKQPAPTCGVCPIQDSCPYVARAGFNFPVGGKEPIYHQQSAVYGGDLCVYSPDKDLVDHQLVIMECEDGLRGDFTLQMFGNKGRRITTIRGEQGLLEFDSSHGNVLKLTSQYGDESNFTFAPRAGGHGGTDPRMISRFVNAIRTGDAGDSGLEAGLNSAIIAFKADESRLSGQTVDVAPSFYQKLDNKFFPGRSPQAKAAGCI